MSLIPSQLVFFFQPRIYVFRCAYFGVCDVFSKGKVADYESELENLHRTFCLNARKPASKARKLISKRALMDFAFISVYTWRGGGVKRGGVKGVITLN